MRKISSFFYLIFKSFFEIPFIGKQRIQVYRTESEFFFKCGHDFKIRLQSFKAHEIVHFYTKIKRYEFKYCAF